MTPRRSLDVLDDDPLEIEVGEHLAAIWRRRLPIAVATLLAGVLAAVTTARADPEYTAAARLVVLRAKLDAALIQPLSVYQALIQNNDTAAAAIKSLGLDKPPRP